jgi:iron complex outermembrane receptor protein
MIKQGLTRCLLALFWGVGCTAQQVVAESRQPSSAKNVFTLGQITVTETDEDEAPLATSTLSSEEMWDFDKDGLADALNLIPGVSTTAGAGNRNEAVISVRGFDRWQVPLLLDGIRLYLPADNRIDYDRFLTPDLAQIQVSKGYVSVLNGPDGMGGAINLVTRKPLKPFEGELRSSVAFSNEGDYNGNTSYASMGSRQELFYLQASVQQRDSRSWYLSDDFSATPVQAKGQRINTAKKDWRGNLKAALTPNDSDEYSLNFVKQDGEKHGAGSVYGTSPVSTWDWPKWDTWSLYWLSHSQLGEESYVKTRAYYNKFENDLVAYTNATLSAQNWTSYYDDTAVGASVELGTDLIPRHTLKTALHWRRDEHNEWQLTHASNFVEPKQKTTEDVYSVAVEDTLHLTPQWDLVTGFSRDVRRARKAQEYASDLLFDQPQSNSWASNYQAALLYHYRENGKLHFSVSERTRFPTMFERFSSRFGGALSNPWLEPERALNLELGIADQILPGLEGSAALFHSKVEDAIESVSVVYNGDTYSQSQNVGEATFQGAELSFTLTVSARLEIGGHYSYVSTDVDDPNDPTARLTTTPRHSGFLYTQWRPLEKLSVIPSLELRDDRWSSNAQGNGYVRTGGYELMGLKLEYELWPNWQISVTGRNLMDKNYAVVDGYPQEGRNFVLATRLQF